MDKFKLFNATPYANESVHSCIQTCLKESNKKYAGIMADKQCYCGDKYNQTFATAEEDCNFSCSDIDKCEGNGKISIYNTDYDVKPLFSIPGNNTKFLEVWNRKVTRKFGNMFTGFVMRSPAIDWWNQNKTYHKPEYVSLMALNLQGQLLWAIDFFTNDTNANIENWMTKDRVLPNEFINSSSKETLDITIDTRNNEIRITESENDYVWFHRGNVNNDRAIVTVVSQKMKPLPDKKYPSKLIEAAIQKAKEIPINELRIITHHEEESNEKIPFVLTHNPRNYNIFKTAKQFSLLFNNQKH
ncbi:uncharacterized protein LOC134232505 [Saccostrea cucullata]|uniref:uncharacterized protein LOC134232505 n=1 Tax=Saccostrea cuccullata TaxID=36930 RepID=UPI002ED62633